jgi:hypothetical protein
MKICIELNEEMKTRWEQIKRCLEFEFEHAHGISGLPDDIVFLGLLVCFENEAIDFPSEFSTEEAETIAKRIQRP